MYQRLVRAKRKIKTAGIPYRIPDAEALPDRLHGVLHVIHLVYAEGHVASSGDDLMRVDLCHDAIRLCRLVAELLPDEAEASGLFAFLLLTGARRPSRTDSDGVPVAVGGPPAVARPEPSCWRGPGTWLARPSPIGGRSSSPRTPRSARPSRLGAGATDVPDIIGGTTRSCLHPAVRRPNAVS
jgi:hypothetical protein